MISIVLKCLLLWQISILGGAFDQEGSGGGCGRDNSICARKLTSNPSKGHFGRLYKECITSYHLSSFFFFFCRFGVRCGIQHNFYCGIPCVIDSWCVIVHGSQEERTFQSIGTTM